ncbi:MAG: hypothetical protein KDC87_16045, partial [Planctomycetes bacterium]|nr:hypothetical protein [Planctomycetota bacterium]
MIDPLQISPELLVIDLLRPRTPALQPQALADFDRRASGMRTRYPRDAVDDSDLRRRLATPRFTVQ